MKNFLKLSLVICGFAFATIATTEKVSAKVVALDGGGCYGAGACGTTAGGTHLNGSWRE
jgi:hypothetical protein